MGLADHRSCSDGGNTGKTQEHRVMMGSTISFLMLLMSKERKSLRAAENRTVTVHLADTMTEEAKTRKGTGVVAVAEIEGGKVIGSVTTEVAVQEGIVIAMTVTGTEGDHRSSLILLHVRYVVKQDLDSPNILKEIDQWWLA